MFSLFSWKVCLWWTGTWTLHGETGGADPQPRPWNWEDVQPSLPGLCGLHYWAAQSARGSPETQGAETGDEGLRKSYKTREKKQEKRKHYRLNLKQFEPLVCHMPGKSRVPILFNKYTFCLFTQIIGCLIFLRVRWPRPIRIYKMTARGCVSCLLSFDSEHVTLTSMTEISGYLPCSSWRQWMNWDSAVCSRGISPPPLTNSHTAYQVETSGLCLSIWNICCIYTIFKSLGSVTVNIFIMLLKIYI